MASRADTRMEYRGDGRTDAFVSSPVHFSIDVHPSDMCMFRWVFFFFLPLSRQSSTCLVTWRRIDTRQTATARKSRLAVLYL